MKKVLLVTGATKECGIYQYAESLYDILKTSKKYQFEFLATHDEHEFSTWVHENDPCTIIYNHHPVTLRWLNNGITRPVKNMRNIKQIVLFGHEHVDKFTNVDSYVYTDPTMKVEEHEYAGLPPVMYYDDIQYSKPSGTIKIGTSGIGNITKNLSAIIKLINEQFTEDVILNLHVSNGAFVDPTGKLSSKLIEECRSLANPNVQINVNQEFLDKEDLIRWLNGNDINLYWYSTSSVYGVSSSLDRALASRKPFGVNDSSFLKHMRRDFNDLTKTPIKDIIAAGAEPLNEFYDKWNAETVVSFYERIVDET
jgi:hypothetical protein